MSEISISGSRTAVTAGGKPCVSTSRIHSPATRKTNLESTERRHVRCGSGRSRPSLGRLLSLLLCTVLLTVSELGVAADPVPTGTGFNQTCNLVGSNTGLFEASLDTEATVTGPAALHGSGPALPAATSVTSETGVRTTSQPSSPADRTGSEAERPEEPAAGTDVDFKDEYFSSQVFDYDENRFTDNFTVYEQGFKEIIVKNRLRDHVEFWESIGANSFILDTIKNGYKIPFYSLPGKSISENNMSAKRDMPFVKEAIQELLDRGLVEKCSTAPTVVNPLSVSTQNNGKKRLILDLREVNKHIWKQSVKYEDLRLALMYLEKDSWMIKFDIHSAYHFLDIYYPHTDYLGCSIKDDNGNTIYIRFLVLPFGLGVAPYLYTKFTRPLIAKWRSEGKKVIMFLDDGFGTGASYLDTQTLSKEVKTDLLKSGLIPKAGKSIWEPVQVLEWLGAVLNSREFTISIPKRRLEKALGVLKGLNRKNWVAVRDVASFVGQIISMSIVIGPVAQIMSRYLSMDVLKARTWNSYINLSQNSLEQLSFWENMLYELNVKSIGKSASCSRVVYSDASASGFAGYEVSTINGISHGSWTIEESAKSSAWRELVAVYRVLKSLVHILRSQRIKWFTDNQSVCSIVQKGSMKWDLQEVALKIFHFASANSIHLEMEWIPRTENARADYLSKILETDDWGISFHILDMIETRWGQFEVDFFASEHNRKKTTFYSRFWCPDSAGVDAFTVDWSNVYGLFVPPVVLVSRVLRKMRQCAAKGVLVVPEWKSANFWPLVSNEMGFYPFVIDVMYLPTEKEFYVPCKNGRGIFGTENLRFRMLALAVSFV